LDKRLRIEEIEIPCSLKASMSMAVVATRGMAPAMKIEAQRKHKNGSVLPLPIGCMWRASNKPTVLCCGLVLFVQAAPEN
jgi:hypothetical protein